jgi:hypothetical protein
MDSDTFQVFTFLTPTEVSRIGGIPRDAIVGLVAQGTPPDPRAYTPQTFRPNPGFLQFLSQVIRRCAHEMPLMQDEARRVGDGAVYLIDGRTADPQGSVPPEDILGFVRVDGGQIVPESFELNESYALVTSRGLFTLPPDLHERLLDAMRSMSLTGGQG